MSDLLEFLKYVLNCTYISDLRTETYNIRAKEILDKFDPAYYSLNQIKDAIEYVYTEKSNDKK